MIISKAKQELSNILLTCVPENPESVLLSAIFSGAIPVWVWPDIWKEDKSTLHHRYQLLSRLRRIRELSRDSRGHAVQSMSVKRGKSLLFQQVYYTNRHVYCLYYKYNRRIMLLGRWKVPILFDKSYFRDWDAS